MKAKKIVVSILLVCTLFVCAFGMLACTDDLPDNSGGVEVSLIVLDLNNTSLYEESLSTTKSSLYEILNEFEGLQIQSTSSYLGAYVTAVSVGTIEENDYGNYFAEETRLEGNFAESTFIAVYHDINDSKLKDLGGYAGDLSYGEKTYFYSGVGISQLPLYDGATYILKLASY